MKITYSILDPTGNITALVESTVRTEQQPETARQLMLRHPEVEQVGFVRFGDGGNGLPELRMAGGEFCGNASMSAAALFLLRQESEGNGRTASHSSMSAETVRLQVSGASGPVGICLERKGKDCFRAGITMPPAKEIRKRKFVFGEVSGELPVVRMEGISHIIIEPESVFFSLRENKESAGRAVRCWCGELSAECLGLMFVEGRMPFFHLMPLVYVPAAGTEFWENSCASGSAAAGIFLADTSGTPVDLQLQEPGGTLRVQSDPGSGETRLYGTVRLLGTREMEIRETE